LIRIRLATVEEAAVVAAVLRQSFLEFEPLYTPGGFEATALPQSQVLIRMKEGPVWVAARDGIAVGTVSGMVKADSVYIRGMAVVPGARGCGAGSQLLRTVEAWAGEQGAVRIFLSTTPFLAAAIGLYKRAGFKRAKDGAGDLFGTPLFTMVKSIAQGE
jgi:GNAT superfamily N-acetyltransferase